MNAAGSGAPPLLGLIDVAAAKKRPRVRVAAQARRPNAASFCIVDRENEIVLRLPVPLFHRRLARHQVAVKTIRPPIAVTIRVRKSLSISSPKSMLFTAVMLTPQLPPFRRENSLPAV